MTGGLVRGRWLLVWMLVVSAGASVAWVAIGLAGREVTTLGQSRGPVAMSPTSAPVGPSVGSGPSTPDPDASSPPAADPASPASTKASAPSVSSRPGPPRQTPAEQPPTPPSTSAALVVTGGTVWAVCTGAVARIDHVTPNAGWSSELEARDDGPPEAKFTNAQTGAETEVRVVCAEGHPVIGSS